MFMLLKYSCSQNIVVNLSSPNGVNQMSVVCLEIVQWRVV